MEYRWGVCLFKSLYTTSTDVLLTSWDDVKKAIHKECHVDVTHDEFVAMKKANGKRYGGIKAKNGVLTTGINNETEPGLFSCAAGSDPIGEHCLLALDYDDGIPSNFRELFENALAEFTYTAYTTVSSTTEKMRWRIMIPLAKKVDAETRNALIRTIVERIGWAGYDETGLRPSQRMALPVTLRGQETTILDHDGKFLDTDILPEGWLPATLPQSPKERENVHKAKVVNKRSLTPMEYTKKDKAGLIGAFLKAYTCASILERAGLYKKTSENEHEQRWSRTGDGMGGIVVYPDDKAMCYYASDKLAGLPPLNSFGLYMHLFCDGDYKKAIAGAKADAEVRNALVEQVKERKPATAGPWEDADSYTRGWQGILERLAEYKHYKYMVVNEKKGTGYWYKWNGRVYENYMSERIAVDALQVMRITAALNPELAEEYNPFFTDNSKCLRLIKSFPGIDGIQAYRKAWNSDMNILVFRDGVLHIDKYVELRKNGGNLAEAVTPHSPDLLVTQMSDTSVMEALNPDPEALAFLDGFLNEVMPDPEVLRYMMTGIGSSLTDVSRDSKILILQGEAGRNGKTSFIDCLSATLGKNYYGSADAENFRMGAKNVGAANPQIDRLRNVRLAAFSEVSPAIVLDIAELKKFWGGSDVDGRTLFEEGGPFVVRFRGLFDLNCMPKLSDPSDRAFKKRLRIIPWKVSFYGREKPEIQRRLQEDEHVHAAMLARLLDGLFRWFENGQMLDRGGADIPVGVQATTDEYYSEIDDIEAYIEGFLDITNAPDDFLTVDEILADYARSGGTDIRKNTFSKQLRRKLADIGQTNANVKEGRAYMADGTRPRGWFGLRLKRLSDMELVDKANAESTGRRWSSYDVAELRGMVDKKKLRAIQAVQQETPVNASETPAKTAESHAPTPQVVEAMKCTSTKIKTLDDHRADWGYTAEEIPF